MTRSTATPPPARVLAVADLDRVTGGSPPVIVPLPDVDNFLSQFRVIGAIRDLIK